MTVNASPRKNAAQVYYQHKAVVLGANGFLGSHVTRALLKDGRDVRAMVRAGRDLNPNIQGLGMEVVVGDALDKDSLVRAMRDRESVFYCIVDPRAWLHDPTPLYRVNVEGLRNAMDAALETGVKRFVLSSTVCAIGLNPSGVAAEADAFNWADQATDYVRSRVRGEDLFMEYCRRGLPGIALNVAMPYGAGDSQPTAHGDLLKLAARGLMPAYLDTSLAMVGVEDAARAMILAEERGRVGERYIISGRLMSFREAWAIAARHAGRPEPFIYIPMPVMNVICWLAQRVCYLLGRETVVTKDSLRLSFIMKDFDTSKARSELGWQPRPMEDSIREAVDWFKQHP
jgi:dihydroflavonol-4-reductase